MGNGPFPDCLVVHPQEMDRQAEWSMAAEEAKEAEQAKADLVKHNKPSFLPNPTWKMYIESREYLF